MTLAEAKNHARLVFAYVEQEYRRGNGIGRCSPLEFSAWGKVKLYATFLRTLIKYERARRADEEVARRAHSEREINETFPRNAVPTADQRKLAAIQAERAGLRGWKDYRELRQDKPIDQ